jgi:hypothetical protein
MHSFSSIPHLLGAVKRALVILLLLVVSAALLLTAEVTLVCGVILALK